MVAKSLLFIRYFLVCAKGATAIEYAFIVAAMALSIVAIVFTMGDNLAGIFTDVQAALGGTPP